MDAQSRFKHFRLPLLRAFLINAAAILFATTATAAAPVGTWNVAGQITVLASFPQIIKSTTSLNAKTLGMQLTYGSDQSFKSSLLGLEGTWRQNGNKIDIDLGNWMNDIKSSILAILPPNTTIEASTAAFSAKVVSDRKLLGKMKLVINATIPAGSSLGGTQLAGPVRGRITIQGTLTNSPASASARILGAGVKERAAPVELLNHLIQGVSLFQAIAR
jgi:hypothetical protein